MKESNSRNPTLEINFDGLVGPSHNYAGLSHGNVASKANRNQSANPREAALQGLEKMRYVASRGIPQAVLPPQVRPDLAWLQRLGFSGKAEAMLEKVAKADPVLLAAAWSASSMWSANAATISPSADSEDGKVHITPANLSSQIHRSLESSQTALLLKHIFPGDLFVHHTPLPKGRFFGDEGAANHIRLAPNMDTGGIQIFVYGQEATVSQSEVARRFIARQSLEASKAVSRLHPASDPVPR